ncbi:PREDICTED: uncharacterized protein LOC107338632 [Acropora digitifera]|uniref:uncharacterized protein LOC107338632 n=1 Tax=Acropora digitifera TaxID=70779 RepID=UPI00077AF232|nr:PREDICTED: uncharacterized protein LOC107338632 [Acropora digitifera]
MESFESTTSSTSAEPKPKHRRKATKLPSRSSTPQPSQDEPMQAVEAMDVSGPVEVSEVRSPFLPVTEPAEQCASCCAFMNEKRMLNNSVLDLRTKLNDKSEELKRVKNKLELKGLQSEEKPSKGSAPHGNYQVESEVEDKDETEEEKEVNDSTYESEEEPTAETESDEHIHSDKNEPSRISAQGTNIRTEPKHIVFLSQLLLLFGFCHSCKADNPQVDIHEVGTKVVVTTTCSNPKCQKPKGTWQSQPFLPGSKLAAGNFLLCLAILLAGGSASKVFRIFSHMGLGCLCMNTFFRYQRNKLFPTILLYWEKYQQNLLEKVKAIEDGITIAGDGRHDSMGHCAKYGAYTIFCFTLPMILHFSLIQRNQTGSSPAMEFEGLKSCMEFLIGYDLLIKAFVSD